MDQFRLLFAILCIALPVIVIQFLFARFTRSRFLIYLLPSLAFIASLLFIFIAYYVPLEGFANLGYVVMAIIGAGVFIISIIAALIFDFLKRRKART